MKYILFVAAVVLPTLVFAFWPSEAADLPKLPDDETVGHHKSTLAHDSLIEAARAFSPEAFVQEAKIFAPDGAANYQFGDQVAISGNTAIVGMRLEDGLRGSAYIFVQSGQSWAFQQKLLAPDGAFNDTFAHTVAIDGNTVVIGAPLNTSAGAAYVFVRNGTVWTLQQKLTASDRTSNARFGVVDLNGDTIIVGADNASSNGNPGQGAAYVYLRSASVWTEQQKLTSPTGGQLTFFGLAVAVDTNTAVVGVPLSSVAHVFTRSGSVWTFQQTLTSPNGADFGASVDIRGDTIVVGAPFETMNRGAVYVFTRSGSVWTLQQRLSASDPSDNDEFGVNVGIDGNIVVVGTDTDPPQANSGAAYIFQRSGATWTQQQKLTASDQTSSDYFGFDVAISGSWIIAGSPGDDFGSLRNQGSAYIFRDFAGPTPTATPTPIPTATPTPTPIPVRNLRVETSYVAAPASVSVPIALITSFGNERTVSFSLSYEVSRVGSPSVTCGPDAPGCTIMPNTSMPGFIGVTVTFASPPAPGERRIATVTFASTTGGAANTPVLFASTPTPQVTRDAAGNQLPTGYTGGFVVFTERGFEGDLATRFTGDNVYRANDVEIMRAFISGSEQPNAVTNEFERADVAPYGTKGDGRLLADDFQLVKNYVANLVAPQTAGGPDAAIPVAPFEGRRVGTGNGSDWVLSASKPDDEETARTLRIIENPNNEYSSPLGLEEAPREGRKVSITVEMDSLGDETVALFTLGFDPSILNNPVVNRADGTSEGVTLTANTSKAAEGELTVLLDSATPFTAGYSKRLVTVTFDLAKNAAYGETAVTFHDMPSLAGADARPLRVGAVQSSRLACLFLNQ